MPPHHLGAVASTARREKPYTNSFIDHYLTGKVYPHGHDTLVQLVIGAAVVVAYVGLVVRQRTRVSTRLTA